MKSLLYQCWCKEIRRKLCTRVNSTTAQVVTENQKFPKRVFSGIQPTGQIHLGNYFGALRQWVKFQEEKDKGLYEEAIFSIVDLHAITLPQDPEKLKSSILQATATILACGIDPDKSILFLQSNVPLHCQLAWVLSCMITMPKLAQLPSFKEKTKNLKDIPVGLYTYPVLQAADILLYKATHVPIGEDNVANLQVAHHLARTFNRMYGNTFALPTSIVEEGMLGRIRSLRKPENKMSKSEPDSRSRISVIDSPDDIVEKLKKAVTDFTSAVTYDNANRPGVSNLILLHSLCTGENIQDICDSVTHLDTGQYKLVVAEAIIEHLKPMRSKLLALLDDPSYILQVLKTGKEKAEAICTPQWEIVCSKVGISPGRYTTDQASQLNNFAKSN